MGLLYGALDIKDSERPFTDLNGARLIWDYTQELLARYNREVDDVTRIFVQGDTTEFKERYELAGVGYMQKTDPRIGSQVAAVSRTGNWDVAYPLNQYEEAIAYNDIALAYLSMGQFEAAIQTVLNVNNRTIFYEIMRALFNNAPPAFSDWLKGSLTVVPLANGDAVTYPQVFGSDTEATENFYLAPNYAESGITDTNNPFQKILDVVEPHFGSPTGGTHVVVFVNRSAMPYVELLTDFVPTPYWNVQPGDHTAVPVNVGGVQLPEGCRIAGVCNGCTIVVWSRIPSGWMVATMPGITPAPIKRRVDDTASNLTPGLKLINRDQNYPFTVNQWRNRYGYAVGNRLGAVVVALNGTTSYTVPTLYQ